jgi:transposase
MGAEVVIPPKSYRIIQREYDKELYKERNFVERLFQ